MQSCLTLTRAYMAKHETELHDYIEKHPAVTNPAEGTKAKYNTNLLMSKINSHMLMNCEQTISEDKIKEMQKWKASVELFDLTKPGYKVLVTPNLSEFDVELDVDSGHKIEFTQDENLMLNLIEDISDSMSKDIRESRTGKKGAINIAFMDVSEMSGFSQAVYLIMIYIAMGVAFYWFYRMLVKGPEEAEKTRLARIDAKKAKKDKKH